MFDELLSQFQGVLSEAKALKGPKIQANTHYNNLACDITKPFGSVASFGKQQRFKQLQKQELKTEHVQWEKASQKQPPTGFTFQKIERFEAEKPKYNETYLNPNITAVKKNTTNKVPIYKKTSVKDLSKSNVSVSTVASDSLRGPGIYKIKQQIHVKNGAFAKDNRFKKERQTYEDNPLIINQNQTRRRPPSCAVIKNAIPKNRQLISREKQEELRERMKMVYWQNIPLQFDRLFKDKRSAIIREDYFNLKKLRGVQKRCAILMMIDRMNYLRGGFEQKIQTEMDAACAVIYRKSTPKPFKFSEMDPGPDYYYPTDDLIKKKTPIFSFGKEGVNPKKEEYDYRDYQIGEQVFKHGGNIIINPEPSHQHRLTEDQIKKLQRGPGFYDCLFSQIEKRPDIGIIKLQPITQKNDRQNNIIQKRQINDGLYFPEYTAIDPNIPAPLFKQPAQIQPQHLPQKVLFPQHWLFYDGDLNKVRAEIGKNIILAKNMSFQEYQNYRVKFQRFKEYLELQRKGPDVGEYTVGYSAIDPHIPAIQISKMQQKTLIQPIIKPEGDSAGDNLILNPAQIKQHLPNIDWGKMQGREGDELDREGEPKQGDRLILNPNKPEKHIPAVDFKRQQGRPQRQQLNPDSQGPMGDILILDPKPIQKHIINIDFSKQAERPNINNQQNQMEEVIPINITQQKIIKGVPFSRLSSVRLVPLLRQKKGGNNQE